MTEPVVAAIDCGTNSIRLLVASRNVGGDLTDLAREMRIVRLGQGVDATGGFAPEAIERTRAALADYVHTAKALGATRIRMVATSATRDVEGRDGFFGMTAELLGSVVPGAVAEVISGDEEARLSFRGAVAGLGSGPDHDGPVLVTDLGGGSTELVLGEAGSGGGLRVTHAFSADIGCVRLTERALASDPPTEREVDRARGIVEEQLDAAAHRVPIGNARTWVGVAGTFTTLAALAHGLTEYDPVLIHRSRVPIEQLVSLCRRLVGMTSAERLALGPMHPGRADVIGGGALVAMLLARRLAASGVTELVVSEHDILDGVALGLTDES
ncbi:Ppx/GppA phosphatase family protein [Tsukamurella sp. 8F]|uniref:Ppx/GppA phosphatase family protein n=1 Tax=unclassified Tsukamurella TaxID=2633480 RepID=UPI0023B9CACB|nr:MULTISPECIES: Ppx/GppA phosphatase family protein [unclassified Tsukamurella]MDF0530185.1 Ppx/GppA phosphatase family protein [Tsukamurella sp. 8J]MDF0586502.1 Ppx/GppA phosphatase family protein [Tsukamurella sp. 8F]